MKPAGIPRSNRFLGGSRIAGLAGREHNMGACVGLAVSVQTVTEGCSIFAPDRLTGPAFNTNVLAQLFIPTHKGCLSQECAGRETNRALSKRKRSEQFPAIPILRASLAN
jgi:hypothetical protein